MDVGSVVEIMEYLNRVEKPVYHVFTGCSRWLSYSILPSGQFYRVRLYHPPIFHTNLKAWSVWALHALTFKRYIFPHLLLLHFSSRLFAAPLETSPFNRSAGTIKAKVLCI